MSITLSDLESLLDGQWLHRGIVGDRRDDARFPDASGVSIDSRTLQPGAMFFAIGGENFDGHDFVKQAFDAGASVAVVSKPVDVTPEHAVLIVNDTVEALQRLARIHRQSLKTVIAVAGSNGKTTTRHILHHILTSKLKGTQSPKSFNNHLGVPLTLLNASPDDDFVVIEVGTNHPGEIEHLAGIVMPTHGIVTSIGEEHLEFFHDLEGVAREEFSILPFIFHKGIAAIPNLEYPLPEHACDLQRIDLNDTENPAVRAATFVNLPGQHNQLNAALAATVALHMGLGEATISERLRTVEPVEMRSVLRYLGRESSITTNTSSNPNGIGIHELLGGASALGTVRPEDIHVNALCGITLLEDCYNANPSSMAAAIQTLKALPAVNHVAILGDMFELGDNTPELHAKVGRLAAEHHINHVIFIGEHMAHAAAAFEQHQPPATSFEHIATFEENLPQYIADTLDHGDAVLIKASRGMRLERLVPAIVARFEG